MLAGEATSLIPSSPSGLQRTIVVAGRGATVHQEGGAGDEGTLVAHEQLCHVGDLVGGAGAACGTLGEHVLVEIPPPGPLNSSTAKGVTMMPGAMAFRRAPRLPHSTDCAITRFSLQRLAS